MPRLIVTIIAVSLLGGTAALAQGGKSSGGMGSSGGVPQAPVGHRQPSQADISAGQSKGNDASLGQDADDKALDKKIKSICRGC